MGGCRAAVGDSHIEMKLTDPFMGMSNWFPW